MYRHDDHTIFFISDNNDLIYDSVSNIPLEVKIINRFLLDKIIFLYQIDSGLCLASCETIYGYFYII